MVFKYCRSICTLLKIKLKKLNQPVGQHAVKNVGVMRVTRCLARGPLPSVANDDMTAPHVAVATCAPVCRPAPSFVNKENRS